MGEEKLFEYNSFSFPVTNVLWSPDNNKLAMLSPDKNNIKIYDFTLEIVTDIFLPEKDIWKNLLAGPTWMVLYISQVKTLKTNIHW